MFCLIFRSNDHTLATAPARRSVTPIEVFRGFLQSLQANASIVP
jgi:hypothetical protein